jgi:phospholipid/cholesterol/gamma-HCH transport system substrate-binding protein
MRSRTVREGSVGLLLLLGTGVVVGVIAWLRGASLGRQAYTLDVELVDALGLDAGSPVMYRGVKVGRVRALTPSVNGVTARFDITPASLVIPRDSIVEVTQSGFIGKVGLSIRPPKMIPASANLSPFKPDCDSSTILCAGDRLDGKVGANFDDLIRSTTRLSTVLSEGELMGNVNTTLKNFSTTARDVSQLSRNANRTLRDVSIAARGFTGLSGNAQQQLKSFGTAADSVTQVGGKFSTTADDISETATEVTSLIQTNRGTLINTLDNLNEASQELKVTVANLSPIISRIEQGKLVDNLETLAANGAQVSENLKVLSTTLNNPVTLLGLAQTLDSARVTFQNTQKITTDLEQLTGNAEFRKNLIRLINGLSKLVSSTQDLDRHMATLSPDESASGEPAVTPTAETDFGTLHGQTLEQPLSFAPLQESQETTLKW